LPLDVAVTNNFSQIQASKLAGRVISVHGLFFVFADVYHFFDSLIRFVAFSDEKIDATLVFC